MTPVGSKFQPKWKSLTVPVDDVPQTYDRIVPPTEPDPAARESRPGGWATNTIRSVCGRS